MTVFTDFHHAGLLASLIRLFETRLGGQVYRPIGEEWFTNGFWKIYDHPATVKQFLGINSATPDGTPRLNQVHGRLSSANSGNIYSCVDISGSGYNKAIDFDGFMANHFDIVIASIPAHIEPFRRLCELHPSKPKLIYQVGNSWTIADGTAPNIMASARIDIPSSINHIIYHQEFDTKVIRPKPPTDNQKITSFVNCFSIDGLFAEDWQLFQTVELKMPHWKFVVYGGQCRDGVVAGDAGVANEMADSMFVWHTKRGGNGYGHVIHSAPACARPLIVKREYYIGKLAEPLLIDGKTCICIDNMSADEVVNKIIYYSEPTRWLEMSRAAAENFGRVVDFDWEEVKVREFLYKLV